MGRHGSEGVGAHDVLLEANRAFDRKLLDETGDRLGAVFRGQRLAGAGESEVVQERERKRAALAEVLAEVFDVDLPFGRGGDRGQLRQGFPVLGVSVRLVDDEPDLVEPTLEHAHTGVFHDFLAVDADGVASFLGGEEAEVLRAEFLLQRGEVCLDAPTGTVVDQGEPVTIIDTASGRRAQDDTATLGVRLLLQVAGLNELTEDKSADHIKETGEEDEEDDVEAETLDGGGRQHPVVGRVLHEFSAAGGTPMRSMAAFWVSAMGMSPTAPTRVARMSCSPRCHTVSSEGEEEA